MRIKFNAYLGNIKERIQIDIGFGDKIIAGPVIIDFPVLLDFPAPKLKVYSIESAIAEKFEAIVFFWNSLLSERNYIYPFAILVVLFIKDSRT